MKDPDNPLQSHQGQTNRGPRCRHDTAASATAIAKAMAQIAASTNAVVRLGILLVVIIAIGIFFSLVASVWTHQNSALLIFSYFFIVIITVIPIGLAKVLAVLPKFIPPICTFFVDVPPLLSLANPENTSVVWETVETSGRAHHVEVVHSADNGATFQPIDMSEGRQASNLPLAGSFPWKNTASFAIGQLILVRAIAFDAAGIAIDQSQIKSIRVTA